MNSPPRPYRMTVRAQTAAQTGERILDSATELFWDRPSDQLALQDVADRAGVTVQTVIRRFGGKDGLLAAAAAREYDRVDAQRREAPVGDTAAAVRVLVDHYEQMGDKVLTLLAEERRLPALVPLADQGRALHREWCARVFAPSLRSRPPGAPRSRLLAQLVAVCDVYVWSLLRRHAGLSRRQTEIALVEMLAPLLEETP